VEVTFDPKDLGQMRADLFTKIRKRARVRLGGDEGIAQARYSGQFTLLSPKKSLDLRLEKPLEFKGTRRVRLLGQLTDTTALRNDVGYDVFASLGFPTPSRGFATVYVNGDAQGLHFFTETLSTDFLDRRGLSFVTLYQAKLGAADFSITTPEELEVVFQPEHGDGNNTDLVDFLAELGRAQTLAEIRALDARLDVRGYLRYLAGATFLQHWDGQANNFYLYREATSNRFKVIPWDLDKIWQGPVGDGAAGDGEEEGRGYAFFAENALSSKLFRVPEYKELYRTELAGLIKAWPPARIEALLASKGAAIEPAWIADPGYKRLGSTHAYERQRLMKVVKRWFARITPLARPKTQAAP
jgi:spore coat protein CotH